MSPAKSSRHELRVLAPQAQAGFRDPVCGMSVRPESAAGAHEHAGQLYYFCAKGCLARFRERPETFLQPVVKDTKPAVQAVSGMGDYTCPMHPEIVQPAPGSCPICGMALEPRTLSAEQEDNPELRDMNRRFWIGLALTLPVFALALSEMRVGHGGHGWLAPRLQAWIELGFATPVVLWAGWPFFERMWASFANRRPNMFTLIGIGTGTAYGYSVVATLFPGAFPPSFRDANGEVGRYFEAASVITVLVLLGQVLELRARSRTSGAIRALLGLSPKTARRVAADGAETDVPLDQVQAGRPFARAPRRKGPGGWRRAGGLERRGRIHDERRGDAGREGGGRPRDRGHAQRHGSARHPGRARGRRHAARADRPHGR